MVSITRHFVDVEGRRVHYRRAGEGPPLVMLHGSPGSSAMMDRDMAAAAPSFTCVALDTPGFGDSEPLEGDPLTMLQLAEATAKAIKALGVGPCPVFGTHTGAAIALELGVRFPDVVSGLVLDGVPIFTQAEFEALFAGYFASWAPDPLGGHFTAVWMRFRDQFTWFPWTSRKVERLSAGTRPSPELIERWVSMFYRSWQTYQPAYRAACGYGEGAIAAAKRLTAPAIFMATSNDMLCAHLDRLPTLKPGQRIERLAPGLLEKSQTMARFAAELPNGQPTSKANLSPPVGRAPGRQFIPAGQGQIHVRVYGDPSAPAVILLHDAPGSGLMHEPMAASLSDRCYVVVPDLPGNGDSDDPEGSILEAATDGVIAVADALGLGCCAVAGVGCGAIVAAVLAGRADRRFSVALLDRAPRPDPATAAQIAPDLEVSADGAHWIKAWLMVRDREIYEPWFDGRAAAQRRTQGNFDADWLHGQAFELLKARRSYHRLARAAWVFDTPAALAAAHIPVQIAQDGDLAALIRSSLP
jgi:pimeloyl-ACP methyl ester carboxylesterase